MAATEVQTRRGTCSVHGSVEGRRELPRMQFPFVYFMVKRMLAQRQPFACPACGGPVHEAN